MENASLALKIAGGVLLAVIILSLVTWGFKQFGILPAQQDASMTTEQLAKFNQEFEVYRKTKMYGVDVISCLNKVYNYNEKYILETGRDADGNPVRKLSRSDESDETGGTDAFYSGTSKHGKEFLINAYVHINSPLKEYMEVYKIDDKTGKEIRIYALNDIDDIELCGNKGVWGKEDKSLFGVDAYTKYEASDKLKEISTDGNVLKDDPSRYMTQGGGTVSMDGISYYALYDDPNDRLYRLLKQNMKKVATNRESSKITIWNRVIWYTALYDFKTRTFECTHMDVDGETGRIKTIAFCETFKK